MRVNNFEQLASMSIKRIWGHHPNCTLSDGTDRSSQPNNIDQLQGKGMFSEAFVILFTGVCLRGYLPSGGWFASGVRGLHPGDLSPWVGWGCLPTHLVLTSSGGHCTGWFASYWNAFVFKYTLWLVCLVLFEKWQTKLLYFISSDVDGLWK